MNDFLSINGIRKSTALFAVLVVLSLGFGAGSAMADDIGGEDIVVPPPAPAPAPPPPPPPPADEERFKLYLTGIVGYSWAKGEAEGKNHCCRPFPVTKMSNRGHGRDETVFGGGALGIDSDLGPVGLRFEIEGHAARGYDMKTKGPVFADYTEEMDIANSPFLTSSNSWAMFTNFWLDLPITDAFDFYFGGGVGFGVHDFTVAQKTLDIKTTSHDDLEFAWQVGTGFAYDVAEWLTLDLGYRYVDFGRIDVYLPQPIGGEYVQHLISHDIVLGIRLNYYSF